MMFGRARVPGLAALQRVKGIPRVLPYQHELRCHASSKKNPSEKLGGSKEKSEKSSSTTSTTPQKPKKVTSKRRSYRSAKVSSNSQKTKEVPVFSALEPSDYVYKPRRPNRIHRRPQSPTEPEFQVLPALNAAAWLDPLKYCRTSSKNSHTHGVSRSISGTDAARRLLRGKKEFLDAARSLQTQPALLQGHGVPPQLFQHCVDMADALLLQFSPHVVECTFHNYNYSGGDSKLPTILRIRSRDATNQITQWPPRPSSIEDWDYHLELYLTVMERLSRNLGVVLQGSALPTKTFEGDGSEFENEDDDDDDDYEMTSSPLLFLNSRVPQWNVDITRGTQLELQHNDDSLHLPNSVPPMPIVEFTDVSERNGHVLIRLQGTSKVNDEFGSARSKEPVSLVFDASFRKA